jgi:hypothetical protein
MATFGKLNVGPAKEFVARCERCGATPYGTGRLCQRCRRRGAVKTAATVFLVAESIFLAALFLAPRDAAPRSASMPHANSALPVALAVNSGWKSFYSHDERFDVPVRHAVLASNAPNSDGIAPWSTGLTSGTLELTSSQYRGNIATVSFGKVKIDCQAVKCSLTASFDQTQPEAFAYQDLSDRTSTVLKVQDYDRFAQRLAVSHDLTLVATLGKGHANVLRFTVSGYDSAAAGPRATISLAALVPPTARQDPE